MLFFFSPTLRSNTGSFTLMEQDRLQFLLSFPFNCVYVWNNPASTQPAKIQFYFSSLTFLELGFFLIYKKLVRCRHCQSKLFWSLTPLQNILCRCKEKNNKQQKWLRLLEILQGLNPLALFPSSVIFMPL